MSGTFQLAQFGALKGHGEGWAVLGKTLLHEGYLGPTPVGVEFLDARHVVRGSDWWQVVQWIQKKILASPTEDPTAADSPPTPGWMTAKQFARAMGVCERTVRNRVRARVFPNTVCVYRRGTQRLLWPEAVRFFNATPGKEEGIHGGHPSTEATKPENRVPGGLPQLAMGGPGDGQAALERTGVRGPERSPGGEEVEGGRHAVAVPGRFQLPRRR